MGFLFSANGRITRKQYWLSFLLYIGLMLAPMIFLGAGKSYTDYMERAQAQQSGSMVEPSMLVVEEAAAPAEEGLSSESDMTTFDDAGVVAKPMEYSEEMGEGEDPVPAFEDATPTSATGGLVTMALFFVFFLALMYSAIVVQIKRWHDQNLSGWLWLINLTGIGSLVTFVMCGFLRGTVGPNQYGPDPRDPA